jgi:TPP-dependent 2-oxoacid decarboxylase
MMEVGINNFLQLPGKYSLSLIIDIYKSIPLTDVGSLVRNNFVNK